MRRTDPVFERISSVSASIQPGSRRSPARIGVYDVAGRRVATLLDEVLPAGRHTVRFEPHGLSPGVYLAMNGRIFEGSRVRKNREKRRFEAL